MMQKNKIGLIALVAVVVALLPGRYLMGIRAGILDDKNQVDTLNSQYETRLATAQSADTDLEANKQIVEVISAGLPPAFNFDQVLIELSDLASRTGIAMASATPVQQPGMEAGASVSEGMTSFNVSVTVAGSLPQLKAFLTGLRTLPRVVLVDAVTLGISEDGEVSTTLPLKVFTWTPPAVVTPLG